MLNSNYNREEVQYTFSDADSSHSGSSRHVATQLLKGENGKDHLHSVPMNHNSHRRDTGEYSSSHTREPTPATRQRSSSPPGESTFHSLYMKNLAAGRPDHHSASTARKRHIDIYDDADIKDTPDPVVHRMSSGSNRAAPERSSGYMDPGLMSSIASPSDSGASFHVEDERVRPWRLGSAERLSPGKKKQNKRPYSSQQRSRSSDTPYPASTSSAQHRRSRSPRQNHTSSNPPTPKNVSDVTKSDEQRRTVHQYMELVFSQLRRVMLAEKQRELQRQRNPHAGTNAAYAQAPHAYPIDEAFLTDADIQVMVEELEQLERALGQHANKLIQTCNRLAIQYMNEKQFSRALQTLLSADAIAAKGAGRTFRYLPELEEMSEDDRRNEEGLGNPIQSSASSPAKLPTWEMKVPYFAPALEKDRMKACAAMENNLGLYHFKLGEYELSLQRMLRAVELERQLQVDTIGITYFNVSQAQWEMRARKRAMESIGLAEEAVERRIHRTKDALNLVRHQACSPTPRSASERSLPSSSTNIEPSPEDQELVAMWLQWREDVCLLARVKEQHGKWLQDIGSFKKAMLLYDQAARWMASIPRLTNTEKKYVAALRTHSANCKKLQRKRDTEEAVLHRKVPLGQGLFRGSSPSSSASKVRSAVVTTVLPSHVEVTDESLSTTEDSRADSFSSSHRTCISPVILSRFSLLHDRRGRGATPYAPAPSRSPSRQGTPTPRSRHVTPRRHVPVLSKPQRRTPWNPDTELASTSSTRSRKKSVQATATSPSTTPRTTRSRQGTTTPRRSNGAGSRTNINQTKTAVPASRVPSRGGPTPRRREPSPSPSPDNRATTSACCGRVRPSRAGIVKDAAKQRERRPQSSPTGRNTPTHNVDGKFAPLRPATQEPLSLAWCLGVMHAFAQSRASHNCVRDRLRRSNLNHPLSASRLCRSEGIETVIYNSLDGRTASSHGTVPPLASDEDEVHQTSIRSRSRSTDPRIEETSNTNNTINTNNNREDTPTLGNTSEQATDVDNGLPPQTAPAPAVAQPVLQSVQSQPPVPSSTGQVASESDIQAMIAGAIEKEVNELKSMLRAVLMSTKAPEAVPAAPLHAEERQIPNSNVAQPEVLPVGNSAPPQTEPVVEDHQAITETENRRLSEDQHQAAVDDSVPPPCHPPHAACTPRGSGSDEDSCPAQVEAVHSPALDVTEDATIGAAVDVTDPATLAAHVQALLGGDNLKVAELPHTEVREVVETHLSQTELPLPELHQQGGNSKGEEVATTSPQVAPENVVPHRSLSTAESLDSYSSAGTRPRRNKVFIYVQSSSAPSSSRVTVVKDGGDGVPSQEVETTHPDLKTEERTPVKEEEAPDTVTAGTGDKAATSTHTPPDRTTDTRYREATSSSWLTAANGASEHIICTSPPCIRDAQESTPNVQEAAVVASHLREENDSDKYPLPQVSRAASLSNGTKPGNNNDADYSSSDGRPLTGATEGAETSYSRRVEEENDNKARTVRMRSHTSAYAEDLSNMQHTPYQQRQQLPYDTEPRSSGWEGGPLAPTPWDAQQRSPPKVLDSPWSDTECDAAQRAHLRQWIIKNEAAFVIQECWRSHRGRKV